MDLTILANFLGKFVKTKSVLQNWQILVKLIEVKSTQPIWQLDEFLPFLLLHAFLDITTLTNFNHLGVSFLENCGAAPVGEDNKIILF